MIEYKTTQTSDEIFDTNRVVLQNDGKLSLTQLWEIILRTKRLPDGLDVSILYNLIRERLCDPEREVRQHALRVLVDLIPVTQTLSLDDHMRALVPELLSNLGHPAPALRKGALDSLRIYLEHSVKRDQLLRELVSPTAQDSVLAAAPFLITPNTANKTLSHVVELLWNEVQDHNCHQEVAAKSLARIRYSLGDERFRMLIGEERFAQLQNICSSYGLPIDYSDGDVSDGDKMWKIEEVQEDKVILETEITLRTGPAITMKIHEESRPNSVNDCNGESEDDASQKMGVIKVLEDDSEVDFYEAARRTPRKVRFGGESVKMRTPESDSSNQEDTIKITVTDAISIKTRRSLIPVRITSLPSTPRKVSTLVKPRLHKSTPDLSMSNKKSRIPLKKSNVQVSPKSTPESPPTDPSKTQPHAKASEINKPQPKPPNELPVRRSSRAEDVLSPVPIHNEIEVFHNLTRSPERRRSTPTVELEEKPQKEDKQTNTYDSFQVCPEKSEKMEDNSIQTFKDINENRLREETETEPMGLHHPLQISSFSTEDELWNKSEALDNLIKMLKQPNTCETLEPGPAALLFEALFACQHLDKLHFLADDALVLLVKGLRPNVLEQCLGRVALGICKVGAPSGVSLALTIMKKCPAKKLQMEIIERCFGHRTREGALQILMAAARLLPSKEVEVNKTSEFAAAALRDRRRRVRHAALETLATLAQLTSNCEILETVNRITEASQDHQYLLRVVRARLSRRQLPTVEVDGTVRYSTPRDQTEVEWLAGVTLPSSPPSSSASSTPSINYWRHNLRHDEGGSSNMSLRQYQDDTLNNRQQIWAVDSSVFPKNSSKEHNKDIRRDPPVSFGANGARLRPVYILQPEAIRLGGRGYRKYDRGRSFSPPKPNPGPPVPGQLAGSAPQNNTPNAQRFTCSEGFRKSFSSEQLYSNEKSHHEPYSFSISSRSSTTSTGSSTRSGIWQRDMRSGIPVPISTDSKFRLRINNGSSNSSIGVGPVIARRNGKVVDISVSKQSTPVVAVTIPPETQLKSALGSPVHTPVVARLSPRHNGSPNHEPEPPPRSSGSESSGYYTPPPESDQAFVKLDTEDHASESEEVITLNDDNNNNDCVDSYNNNLPNMFLMDNTVQRNFTPSSAETSDHDRDKDERDKSATISDMEREERRMLRYSSSSIRAPFVENIVPISDNKTKSKSVVNLQNFLPDISTSSIRRKSVNSAPPLNDVMPDNSNLIVSNIDDLPASPLKSALKAEPVPVVEVSQKLESPKENTSQRRLSKRFARTNSKKSIKSTPRSVRETTPKSSRPSSKPKEALMISLAQLNSNEWEVTIQGLQALSKITRQHPETVEAQIHTVCVTLARQIKNLRSQVARSACHCASELFSTCKRGLDIELEEIAGPLLQRTADTNKFLRADANAALDVMCEHLPAYRVITVVTGKGCTHQNAVVRSASMRLIDDIVKRLGADKIFQMQKEMKDKILLSGANSLTDGSLEARSYAKAMFSQLIGHPQFHRSLLDAVPQSTLRHIAKTLSSIKPHPRT